jgi:hypothetical protein
MCPIQLLFRCKKIVNKFNNKEWPRTSINRRRPKTLMKKKSLEKVSKRKSIKSLCRSLQMDGLRGLMKKLGEEHIRRYIEELITILVEK